MDRRCSSAEIVADWVQEIHQSGRPGQEGQPTSQMTSTRSTYAEFAANAALTLINVAGALLDRQIASQAAAFEREGGFTERLYRVRTGKRRAL